VSVRQRVVVVLALFLAPRLALLFVRQPFFDELFTRWISAHSYGEILQALRYDSGPPLYYFVVHALGDPPLLVTRAISLLFATIGLIALLRAGRFTAAALLAVFPPAVLFSVDARAYSLCAMFVTLAILALESGRPYRAAILLVLAAYSHYYGALFFPLLFFPSGYRRQPTPGRLKPALTLLLFAPGLWLALHQPRAAMAWIGGFPGYPDVLMARPPFALALIAASVALLAAVYLNRFAAMTLLPFGLAIALGIYFPLRFESVIATPLALWVATSLEKWSATIERALITALIAANLAICAWGILDHVRRPLDDYRAAALYLAHQAPPQERIVASGYLYLEALTQLGSRVVAFPPEQAQHPGWRATAAAGSGLPAGAFLWIGERAAPELLLIRRARKVEPLFVNDRAMVARVR